MDGGVDDEGETEVDGEIDGVEEWLGVGDGEIQYAEMGVGIAPLANGAGRIKVGAWV